MPSKLTNSLTEMELKKEESLKAGRDGRIQEVATMQAVWSFGRSFLGTEQYWALSIGSTTEKMKFSEEPLTIIYCLVQET